MKHFFITGTDTEVGKTWFTVSLMAALKKRGFDVMGMKPIATGAKIIDNKLVNEDADGSRVSFPSASTTNRPASSQVFFSRRNSSTGLSVAILPTTTPRSS